MRTTNISILEAEALTATKTGAAVNIAAFHGLVDFILVSSATGGEGETSTVKLQHSDDGSTGWADAGVAFDAVTDEGASTQTLTVSVDSLKKFIRGVNTLAGETPTVTSALVMCGKRNYA